MPANAVTVTANFTANSNIDSSIIGTWVSADGLEYKFNNGSTFEATEGSKVMSGTFTTRGNNLTLNPRSFGTMTGTYSVNGNTLTMTFDGETRAFTRKN